MVQDKPAGVSVLDNYRQSAAGRKGRRSIDVLPSSKGAGADKGSTEPSNWSKKRSRDGGNVATTTRSPGSLPTSLPRREVVEAGSPSPRRVERVVGPIEAVLGLRHRLSIFWERPSIHAPSSHGPP